MHVAVQRIWNGVQELRLGIATRGIADTSAHRGVHYATVDYASLHRTLDRLELRPSDVFVDVGAGKGRVLCVAAQRRVAEVIGVEASEELALAAQANVARLRKQRSPCRVVVQRAEQYDFSAATALYFFNPFEAEVLQAVLTKIESDRGERPLRLAFVMESGAQRAVFERHSWLRCVDRWTDGHAVALYRSIDR